MSFVRTQVTLSAALALSVGCAFEGTGVGPQDQPDAGTGTTDARVVTDARVPDAPETRPDAPPEPDAPTDAPPEPDAPPPCETDRDQGILCVPFVSINADGDLDDWAGIDEQAFDIEDGHGFYIVDDDPNDNYFPSAKLTFSAAHDDQFIYFKLVVADDVIVNQNGSESYEDDGVELFFDILDNDPAISDVAVVFNNPNTFANYGLVPLGDADIDAFIATGLTTYEIELRIDKRSLDITDGDELRFDIAVIDEDIVAGPHGFGSWYLGQATCPSCCATFPPPHQPWCDQSVYATLKLAPQP